MAKAKPVKFLKIRIENSEGIKFYTLDSKGKFSIGYKPDNSFRFFGTDISPKFELLRGRRDFFQLQVAKLFEGEIVSDGCSLTISDLIKHRLLQSGKNGYLLNITEDKRVMLQINDYKFQIEYDNSPKTIDQKNAYWKFSTRLYRQLTSDLLFKSILIILFVLGGSLGYKIHLMPLVAAKKINLRNYSRYIARIIIKPKEQKVPVVENILNQPNLEEPENIEPEAETETKSETVDVENPINTPVKRTVLNKGLLGLIAGHGQSNNESTIIDALIDRGLVRELDELLKSGQILEIDLPTITDIGGNLDDLLSISAIEVDNLISGMEVDDGVELKEKGDVNLESFGEITGSDAALGWRSEQSIRDVIISYMGLVTYTYNRHLKLDPELGGKVVMEITIESTGNVTNCKVISSTVNNNNFENELKNVIKTFKFKPIPEGQIRVQNPFVFYRRDT